MVRNILLILIIILSVNSCYKPVHGRLEQAGEQLMRNVPDSALLLLETIDAANLDPRDYYRYVILKSRAKDKINLDIRCDTLVYEAATYFIGEKDALHAALACFVSGRVCEERRDTVGAFIYYKDAVYWVQKTDDLLLSGAIYYNLGRLYALHGSYYQSIDYLEKSEKKNEQARCCYTYRIAVMELLGYDCLMIADYPRSLHYFSAGGGLAQANKDTLYYRRSLQSLSVVYRKAGMWEAAEKKSRQALSLLAPADSIDRARINLVIAGIFSDTQRNDSAYIYLSKAEQDLKCTSNPADLVELYQLLSQTEEERGNYQEAVKHHQAYMTYRNAAEAAEQTRNDILSEQNLIGEQN